MPGRTLILVLCTALVSAAAYAVDRWLTRDDRLGYSANREQLWEVRDAILRFRFDREQFPATLDQLVDAYIPAEFIACRPGVDRGPEAPLDWNPTTGTLSWPGAYPIRGLVTHRRELKVDVPAIPIRHPPLPGEPLLDRSPDAVQPGADEIVIEAEHFQFLTYGWEIVPDPTAAGGACIHLKEGRGDYDKGGQEVHPDRRAGDVFNISRDNRTIEARCWFEVTEPGTYTVFARTMAHRSNCSNMIQLSLNGGGLADVGHNGSAPFAWRWHRVQQKQLQRGLNFVGFRVYQDDIKVDQVLLTRAGRRSVPAARRYVASDPPRSIAGDDSPQAVLSLSSPTLMIGATNDPLIDIFVLNNGLDLAQSTLELELQLPGGKTRRRVMPLASSDQRLVRFPYDTAFPRPLEMREYLLRCRLVHDGETVEARTIVLYHGFDWWVLGPLPYMDSKASAGPESAETPDNPVTIRGKAYSWMRYDAKFTDHFGVMDLGRVYSGRTYSAMPNVTAYAYTEVMATTEGEYLLKGMGDDQLVVWINGERVFEITESGTIIRKALDRPVTLRQGLNRILYRINQKNGQWQAAIRIRTLEDQPADVIGVPFDRQTVSAWTQPAL